MYYKFLIFFFCLLPLYSSGQTGLIDTILDSREINWLKRNKENIRFAPNLFWPPGDYIDEKGIHQGIVSDYIKIFENNLGVSFQKVHFKNWNNIYKALIYAKADFVGAVHKTTEREEFLIFTEPFIEVPLVILTKKDYPYKVDENHINEMKLAGVIDYSSIEYIKTTFQHAEIMECDDDLTALLQTSLGNTDGTVTDLMSASYIVEKFGINNLSIGSELDFTWQLRFACRKELTELCSILDKLLKAIDEKKRKEIFNKWVNINYIPAPNFFEKHFKLLIFSAVILLLLLIMILNYNIILKSQVRRRTKELKKELEEKKRAIYLSQKNESRLESLFEISRHKTKTIEELFDYALNEAVNLTGSKLGVLYLYNQDEQFLTVSNYLNITEDNKHKINFKEKYTLDDLGVCGDVIRNKTANLFNTCYNCTYPDIGECPLNQLKINHSMVIPIFDDDEIVAVLYMANKETDYDQADARQLILLFNSVWKLLSKQRWQEKLIVAKEKAEESDRLKTAFLANVSHEIRTPLNTLIGFSSLISKDIDIEQKNQYEIYIKNSSDTLLRLIDDILDMSKIEANQLKVKLEDCKINLKLNEIHSNLKILQKNEGKINIDINLKCANNDPDFKTITDPVRFQQIIYNLLDNAVKFTGEGGQIEFGYTLLFNDSIDKEINALQFYVKDTGIGIPKDKTDFIFERFNKIEESATKFYRGTGIGLTIAKRLVKLLGGEIWVESELGKGSVFYFTLTYKPVKELPKTTKKTESEKTINCKGKTFLIAEDVEESFIYISELLRNTGANIIHAKDGNEAVEYCKKRSDIDIVLMDIKMPKMDGYEAIKVIKNIKPDLPIIVQTAYAMPDDEHKAKEAGADDYITKPINESLVFKKIINLI